MLKARFIRGLTIIEVMITLVSLAVLISLAVPAFKNTVEKRRLEGAAATLFEDLNYAKSEAIKQNKTVTVQFDTSEWCYGFDDNPATVCNCKTAPANCTISDGDPATIDPQKVTTNADYANISLGVSNFSGTTFTFDPVRGMVSDDGTLTLTSSLVGSKSVSVSLLGRITMD